MKRWSTAAAILARTAAAASGVKAEEGFVVRGMPTVSSNPTAGTGVGAQGVGIYKVDGGSSPSQVILSGQYTDTDSYNIFAINKMFFDADRWQSNTLGGVIYNNTKFTVDLLVPLPTEPIYVEGDVNYDVTIYVLGEQLLYRVWKNVYAGGQLFYVSQDFNPKNEAGRAFLLLNGIEDSGRSGYGLTLSYDTRTKSEKFFARDSTWINVALNDFPTQWGAEEHFWNALINARKYIPGFKQADVFAMQLYGQYSSDNTPDGALSALGARNILRGFPIGKYKARHEIAAQAEYRFLVPKTRFRLTAFGGWANLSGGSKGTALGNRDSNNGDYYSGGVGVHYILAKEQNLDYRVDIAATSDDEVSVYASINQAF